jgi:hypothetical protein
MLFVCLLDGNPQAKFNLFMRQNADVKIIGYNHATNPHFL